MGRHAHDGAGAVVDEDVVGKPDRDLLAVQRVDRIAAGEDAGLFLVLHAVDVGLDGSVVDVLLHRRLGLGRRQGAGKGMLRGKDHEGRAVQGVGSGGVDRDLLIAAVHREIHLCAVGLADPVGLHLLDLLGPVEGIQIVQETVRILRDAQHPLAEVLLGHLGTAALAAAVHDLFVGQAGLAGRAPVDREFLLVGKAFLEHLDEDPLGPLIESRIGRVDLSVPVVDGRDLVDLLFDILYVLRGGDGRMLAGLDRVVLCRQAEGVPAHRMDEVVALHHLVPAPYIGDHIASPVPHVQAVSGRVREHVQAVIFRFLSVVNIYRVLFPVLSPFFFNGSVVVGDCHSFSSKPLLLT